MSTTWRRRLRSVHPEWWVWPAAAAGVAAHVITGRLGGGGAHASHAAGAWGSAAIGGVTWVAMLSAMTLPMNVPGIRYVAFSSLPSRRTRAMAWYTGGLVAVWASLAPIAVVAHGRVRDTGSMLAMAAVIAVYEASALKRAALRRCRRTAPIRVRGSAAARSCLGFGVTTGATCLATCGPAMLAITLAGHPLWAMLGYTAYALGRRYQVAVPLTWRVRGLPSAAPSA